MDMVASSPTGSRVSAIARLAIVLVALVIAFKLLLTSEEGEAPVTWADLATSVAFTAMALVVALIVVLPRAEQAAPAAAAAAALALAVVGLLVLPLFWFSGAPFALAASAVALSRAGVTDGAPAARRTAATATGGAVAAVSLLIAIAMTVSQFNPTLPQ